MTPEARQKISEVVQKPTLFRRMPTNVIDCDPQIYRFMVRYPEVVVNIWQLMGITKVTADRVGPYLLNAKDGVGTTTTIELIYGDQDTHLMYCEGRYDGPLFPRPLTGRCVLVLRSEYQQTPEQRSQVTNRMDVFLQIDNMAVDAVTRTLHPLFGKSADLNFVQSTQFLERISRTSEENGPGMTRLAQRLDNVQPDRARPICRADAGRLRNGSAAAVATVARNTPADHARGAAKQLATDAHSRQLLIFVSRIADAPRTSSRSITSMISFCRTITRTAHQALSSSELTVGDLKPGVMVSACANFSRGMLYSSSE